MKNTNEVGSFLGAVTNAGYKSMEDGTINLSDVSNLLSPVLKGEDAVKEIGESYGELALATPEQKTQGATAFSGELGSAVPSDDKFDLSAFYAGLQSAISMIARKTRKETADKIAARLQSMPMAASGEPLTGDDLLALIED